MVETRGGETRRARCDVAANRADARGASQSLALWLPRSRPVRPSHRKFLFSASLRKIASNELRSPKVDRCLLSVLGCQLLVRLAGGLNARSATPRFHSGNTDSNPVCATNLSVISIRR